jgi:Uma2 family endonuclease
MDKSTIMETTELSQYELERGKPMPSKNHSILQLRIARLLMNRYDTEYDFLSELSLVLTTGKATPDISVYPKLTIDWLHDEIRVSDPPLAVIEILSPKQGLQDVTEKIDLYFGAGVKSCWVVIPTFQTIHIITPDKQVATFTAGTLTDPGTGIQLVMEEVFK